MFQNFSYEKILNYLEKKLILEQPRNQQLIKVLYAQYNYYLHYPEIEIKNRVEYINDEILDTLPEKNVMFVSNHTTYYMDAALIFRKLILAGNHTIFSPKTNIVGLIAAETLEALPNKKFLEYGGLIPIKRQWRNDGKEEERGIDVKAVKKTLKGLKTGWLLNFPTGTTDPDAIVRPGTAGYIKKTKPVVVPIHITGAFECFGKKGIKSLHNEPSDITVLFKEPLQIDFSDPQEVITAQVSCAIRNP